MEARNVLSSLLNCCQNDSNSKQEEAFEKLSKLKVGALFMEMGSGKTKVALDLIASKKDKVNYILWICPFSIKQEIESEVKKWHPELEIEIVGCETISMSSVKYLDLLKKVVESKPFIVVDESLKIKNIYSKRTQRILQLGGHAKYKLILNGTPISKNVLDLYPQMEFLSPKILKMSYNEFKNKYCEYYVRGRLKGKVKAQYNVEHLVSLIKPYIFDSSLDLGKNKNYSAYKYQIEDYEEYEAIKEKYLTFDCDYDCFSFFSLTTELQHCYCSSKLKKEALNSLIDEIDGQVIVFVKFVDSIPDDEKRIVGNIKTKEREKIIQEFKRGEFKTLYITYGSGAFGLNLQNCRNMIFADHTFDYSQRIQAEARIYRKGQENDVNYYSLDCDCGLDNLIRKCIDKKERLLDEVKREIEKKGAEEWLKSI